MTCLYTFKKFRLLKTTETQLIGKPNKGRLEIRASGEHWTQDTEEDGWEGLLRLLQGMCKHGVGPHLE